MVVRKLKAVNIKKIKEIEIQPPEHLVLVCGKNGQGKTSLMDSIVYGLGGKKFIDVKPIRDGEKEGRIEIDLGEILVTRTFTEKDTYLTVKSKDGATYTNGQDKLNELIKNIYFDPMKFTEMKQVEQKEMLLDLIGVDVKDFEEKAKEAYEQRTVIGRLLQTIKGELASTTKPEDKYFQMQEVSVAEISQDMQEINEVMFSLSNEEKAIEDSKFEIKKLEALLQGERNKLKLAEDRVAVIKKEHPELEAEFEAKKELMETAEYNNEKVRQAKRYAEAKFKVDEYTKKYDEKTEELLSIGKAKIAKLGEAKMPVEGLGIDDNGVTFNGIPFAQLSTSEKIKISLGMAMAANAELKLIRIMDGSLLDSDNMQIIQQMAEANDYQIWVERVDEECEVGFFIQDGEVRK